MNACLAVFVVDDHARCSDAVVEDELDEIASRLTDNAEVRGLSHLGVVQRDLTLKAEEGSSEEASETLISEESRGDCEDLLDLAVGIKGGTKGEDVLARHSELGPLVRKEDEIEVLNQQVESSDCRSQVSVADAGSVLVVLKTPDEAKVETEEVSALALPRAT